MKIAIIDKQPSTANYSRYFDFEFDHYHLSSVRLTKVLKKDVDIDINIDEYDYVLLVGSEALKYFTKCTSVTDFAGYLVEGKFLPLTNPAMLSFKPETKPAFERAVEQIKKILDGGSTVNESGDFRGIQDEEEAYNYLCELDTWASEYGFIAVDTETTSLYPRDGYVLGISITGKPRTGAYVCSDAVSERVYDKFQSLFLKYKTVFHNSKFDLKMLEYHFDFKFRADYDDTLIIHYMLDETQGTHGLKQLALKYTEYGDYDSTLTEFKDDYCKKHKINKEDFTYDLIPFDTISRYAAIDTAVTFELYQKFNPLMRKNDKISGVYDKLMIPGSTVLKKMEENGIPFSKERLSFGQLTINKSIDDAVSHLYEFSEVRDFEARQGTPFNPNSVMQLRTLLFDILRLNPLHKLTGTGAQSTDAEVLESLSGQHPIVDSILTVRKLGKIKNTYLDKILPELDKDGKLRTGFNLTSTTSGRLSSSGKFNAQQIPRDEARVKGSIMVPDGYLLVSQDLATAEMYYAAVLANDPKLQQVFKSGGDFHSSIAHMVFKLPCAVEDVKKLFPMERQAAKAVSFGILYGSGAQKVSDTVTKAAGTLFTIREAQDAIDDYFGTFSKLKKWLNDCKKMIETQGYCYTSFGRKRRLKNVFSSDKGIASHEVRSGINAMVQSLASDINLAAAIDMQRDLDSSGLDANMFMLVHDSIVGMVREDQVEVYKQMLARNTQKDRGFSIAGFPIGIDQSVGKDYSFGSFDTKWGEEFAKYQQDPMAYIPSK